MQSPLAPARAPSSGFSLVELLVTVAIVGVLASVAYPSFMDSLRKSRRSDAVSALTRVQQAQERFRANNAAYAGSFDPAGADPTKLKLADSSPDGHYTLAIGNNTAITYTVTATANAGSPQIHDTKCKVLQIVMNDTVGLVQFGSKDAAGAVNIAANNPCWIK